MEYILQNTDIFDEKIDQKLKEVIIDNKDAFTKGKTYIFKVSFHVNLLDDQRFQKFSIPIPSKTNKGMQKDKIYDVMSYQLKRMEQILNENEIETYLTIVQGDYLNADNIINIEILEDSSQPTFIGRDKNKKRIKVSSIVPSMLYTQENVTKLAGERLSKIFYDFMNIIKDKKLMSEILEIEETEDDLILFRAFDKQYGELWLTTKEKENELLQLLKERSLAVVEKYFQRR